MILNCPSCSARFMISSDALGEAGREVRCGKCGHLWFQAPERDSLDDLTSGTAEETLSNFERLQRSSSANDISFEQHVEKAEDFSGNTVNDLPRALKPDENIEVDFKERVKSKNSKPTKLKQATAAAVAFVIVAAGFYGFTTQRDTLVPDSPFFASVFNKFGMMPQKKQADAKIALDRFQLSRSKATISGTGYVINLTDDKIPIKAVRVELVDLDYKVLKSTEVHIKDNKMEPESSNKIDFSFADTPHEAVSVRAVVVE